MAWIGAAIGAVGGLLSSGGDKNGGAGTQSQSKEPWAPAQPWLLQNILQGQGLQDKYTAQPFSPQQTAAYDNSYAQSDYVRGLIPSLLNQLQSQPVGFDPANPTARPKAWDWNALANGALGQQSVRNATAAPVAAPASSSLGDFIQQNGVVNGINNSTMDGQNLLGNGGYGSFKYGMATPKPGTQAYRDMSAYFANGGADPNGFYGATGSKPYVDPSVNPLSYLWTSGGLLGAGAPGEAEGPASGAPGGAASAGPAGTF